MIKQLAGLRVLWITGILERAYKKNPSGHCRSDGFV